MINLSIQGSTRYRRNWVVRRHIKPGSAILDIGANVGYFSLLFAKWTGPGGTVHAFEPFPLTVGKLRRNLVLNPELARRINVHELAISDHLGTVSMEVPEAENAGCNYLSTAPGGTIQTIPLDEFVDSEGLDRVDLVKVDVEGSEAALLAGAGKRSRVSARFLQWNSTPLHCNGLAKPLHAWLKLSEPIAIV